MKTLTLVLCTLLIATRSKAAEKAAGSPVQLELGMPFHIKDTSGIGFFVRATNLSAQPVMYCGDDAGHPFYTLFVGGSGLWADRAVKFSGTGATVHRLAPGAEVLFYVHVATPVRGGQVRVEMSVLDTSADTKPIRITSESALVSKPTEVVGKPIQPERPR